jgi:hypothetical protein
MSGRFSTGTVPCEKSGFRRSRCGEVLTSDKVKKGTPQLFLLHAIVLWNLDSKYNLTWGIRRVNLILCTIFFALPRLATGRNVIIHSELQEL